MSILWVCFWLVVTDKWLEIFLMSSMTTTKTVAVLRDLFAQYGIPRMLVSDNGPQFMSEEFRAFLVKHVRSSPYHPATNGAAEELCRSSRGRTIGASPGSSRHDWSGTECSLPWS